MILGVFYSDFYMWSIQRSSNKIYSGVPFCSVNVMCGFEEEDDVIRWSSRANRSIFSPLNMAPDMIDKKEYGI